MRFQEILDLYAKVAESDRVCRREYQVSDRIAVEVVIVAYDGKPPKASLAARRFDGACHHLGMLVGHLTPQELVKVAEIRAMVDAWVSGQTNSLPPSTSTRLAELDQIDADGGRRIDDE